MKPNKPTQYDAVLGGDCLPIDAVVLGGMEGIKRRIVNPNDDLNKPRRLIEYDANAQSLLAELMRYFYEHCVTHHSRKVMRLKYQRHQINLKASASAAYPERIDVLAPTYCGYLSHLGLLYGDKATYCIKGKPRQWLDKALLHNALLIDNSSLVHVEIKQKSNTLNNLYLVETKFSDDDRRNSAAPVNAFHVVPANNIFQACLYAATKNIRYYSTYIISCKLWKDGNWVNQEANFPVLASNVIKHNWDWDYKVTFPTKTNDVVCEMEELSTTHH